MQQFQTIKLPSSVMVARLHVTKEIMSFMIISGPQYFIKEPDSQNKDFQRGPSEINTKI